MQAYTFVNMKFFISKIIKSFSFHHAPFWPSFQRICALLPKTKENFFFILQISEKILPPFCPLRRSACPDAGRRLPPDPERTQRKNRQVKTCRFSGGVGEIRTRGTRRYTAFPVQLVMTTSIPLHRSHCLTIINDTSGKSKKNFCRDGENFKFSACRGLRRENSRPGANYLITYVYIHKLRIFLNAY